MLTKNDLKKFDFCRVVFGACLVISMSLIVGGFFCPPQGEIDGSVLTAVGELFAFPTLAYGFRAFELGYGLKVTHGDTTIEINDREEEE